MSGRLAELQAAPFRPVGRYTASMSPRGTAHNAGGFALQKLLNTLRRPPAGYAAWYARQTAWWRAEPGRARALGQVCGALKLACYALYPALLLWLGWQWLGDGSPMARPVGLVRAIAVPALGFALVSWLRVAIAEPRPYEAYSIDQLIPKDTCGKSFPSRHTYSIAVIGMCWLHYSAPVGAIILACSALMAWARVLGGVHYPRDVACGLVLGIVCGLAMWL